MEVKVVLEWLCSGTVITSGAVLTFTLTGPGITHFVRISTKLTRQTQNVSIFSNVHRALTYGARP